MADADIYQTEMRQPVVTVAPGATTASRPRGSSPAPRNGRRSAPTRTTAGIAGFIDSIDWGWFYFLTKPIFAVLHWLNALIGNMGLAIIALTFVLKFLVLPLAYKSYVSMARMKELQPEMEALKERAGEDKQKLQREMMQLYKDKKVNPAAGCLPILIQIPIFFSLYKVIFVTIELRHAPFFGWLQRPVGARPVVAVQPVRPAALGRARRRARSCALIFIGILPILLGISMWLQQKLNPAPDRSGRRQQIFAWMPWVFMFMLGGFASGLVVYWITNNTITFTQQYLIMRSHGHNARHLRQHHGRASSRKPAATEAPGAPRPGRRSPGQEMTATGWPISVRHPIKAHGREDLASGRAVAGRVPALRPASGPWPMRRRSSTGGWGLKLRTSCAA